MWEADGVPSFIFIHNYKRIKKTFKSGCDFIHTPINTAIHNTDQHHD